MYDRKCLLQSERKGLARYVTELQIRVWLVTTSKGATGIGLTSFTRHLLLQIPLPLTIIFILFTLFIMVMTCYTQPFYSFMGVIATLAGVPIYYLCVWWTNKPPWVINVIRKSRPVYLYSLIYLFNYIFMFSFFFFWSILFYFIHLSIYLFVNLLLFYLFGLFEFDVHKSLFIHLFISASIFLSIYVHLFTYLKFYV